MLKNFEYNLLHVLKYMMFYFCVSHEQKKSN